MAFLQIFDLREEDIPEWVDSESKTKICQKDAIYGPNEISTEV